MHITLTHALNELVSSFMVVLAWPGNIWLITGLILILIAVLFSGNQLRLYVNRLQSNAEKLSDNNRQLRLELESKKAIEDKLHSRERQLTNLISSLPGFAYRCLNDEAYTMEYISQGCLEITGYSPSDFLFNNITNFNDVILPEETAVIRQKWEKALAGNGYFEHEYKIKHRDGSTRWVWERGNGTYDSVRQVYVLEGFITDITARISVKEKIAFQRSLYQLISEISASFINSTSSNISFKIDQLLAKTGKFMNVDRTYLLRFSDDFNWMNNTHEWCADGIESVIGELQHYSVVNAPILQNTVKTHAPIFISDVMSLPDSSEKELLISQGVRSMLCLPIKQGDNLYGILGFDAVNSKHIISDTEIGLLQVMANILGEALLRNNIEEKNRQVEEELRKNELVLQEVVAQKDKFFSIIAHDLRSPFTAIVGFSEMLIGHVNKQNHESTKEYAELILNSSKRSLELLMNLLEWARSQTNKITFNPEQLELREIVDETMFVLDNIARQKSISIVKDFTTDISTYADRHMLSTIVRNLVSNAIKFTPTGGEIVITAMQNASSTRLTVSDNGTGIPGGKIESLFTIGNNTSTLGTAEEEGTGLGLILCKEFVDRHGGILEVFSIPEKGSSFSVILPLS